MDESKLREKHRSRIPLVALFCALTGCVAAEESKPCLSLEEVRRFGHAEVIREGLDDHESAAGGGVLGRIRGVVAGPDRTVYVLDRDWQKIVGFGPDGHVTHVVLGGEGEGPGEFITPIDLTETGRGFSVLDYELQRLTEFSWAGEILGTSEVRFKQPWRHLVRGDTVWIGYSSGGPSDDPVFDRLKLSGEPLDRGPTLDEEDRPFGTTVGMAFGAGGRC